MRDYTTEQIVEMHDRNQNFHGKTANLSKIQLYQQIKAKLSELLEQCPDTYRVEGYPPNIRERCAIIWVDLKSLILLDVNTSTILSDAMRMADHVAISSGTSGIRITFGINQIWRD